MDRQEQINALLNVRNWIGKRIPANPQPAEVRAFKDIDAVLASLQAEAGAQEAVPDRPKDLGPHPNCRRCRGSGEAPNAQFSCGCQWEGGYRRREAEAAAPLPADAAPSPALTHARLHELLVAQQAALDAHRWAMPQEHEVTDVDHRLWDATQAAVWALEKAVRTEDKRLPASPPVPAQGMPPIEVGDVAWIHELARDIDFAIDVTEPRDVLIARFGTAIAQALRRR